MLKKDTLYSFTLNPDDQHQYYGEADRLHKVLKYHTKLFQRHCWEYELYPEISTPMDSKTKPRIHFHGFIAFRNTQQLLKWYEVIHYDLGKFAYFDLDTVADVDYYYKYSIKNALLMGKFADIYKMDYKGFKSICIEQLKTKYIKALEMEPPSVANIAASGLCPGAMGKIPLISGRDVTDVPDKTVGNIKRKQYIKPSIKRTQKK